MPAWPSSLRYVMEGTTLQEVLERAAKARLGKGLAPRPEVRAWVGAAEAHPFEEKT